MLFAQITYFLEVAKSLNITEAAARLYMTQPTLSRQISAIESELNMQLFIRKNNSLKLTPAGIVLRDELTRLMADFQEVQKKAERASWGMTGVLKIGVLEGHNISGILPGAVEHMEKHYPNIKLYLQRYTYSKLLELLYNKKLDAIIDYDFHLRGKKDILTIPVQQVRPLLALPKRHPLAGQETVRLADLADESLVIVNDVECPEGVLLVRDTCREFGGFTPRFHFVDTMEDATLWVESGVRCALFNSGMSIMATPSVRQAELPELPPMNVVLGTYQKNDNDALPLLLDYFQLEETGTMPAGSL